MTLSALGRACWRYEIRPFVLAFAFIRRGCRSERAAGWTYSRAGLSPVVFSAFAAVTIPQALVVDLLLSHSEPLRIASAILHVYAIVWLLASAHAMQLEPHTVSAGRVTFYFPLLQSIELSIPDIAAVEHVTSRPRGIPRFGLGPSGIILDLKQPVRIDRPLFARSASRIFVAADDPRSLARALV